MGTWFAETAFSGSLFLAVPVAVIAGLVSFLSPCVVPLLPGYLSYMSGLAASDLGAARRGRMTAGALLFVAGFSVVFVSEGALFGHIGLRLERFQTAISILGGVVLICLGLIFAGWLPIFRRDVRVHKIPTVGVAAAPVLGALFAVGWTPCIGPTLAAVLALAMSEANALRGAVLTAFYCLGLGVPFIACAVAFRKSMNAIAYVRKHQQLVLRIGGALLIFVGVAIITGWWAWIIVTIRGLLPVVTTVV